MAAKNETILFTISFKILTFLNKLTNFGVQRILKAMKTNHIEITGNILVYIASQVQPLYITKLLKLIYLIDEHSVSKTGVPITWLDYKAWQFGPVPPFLFNDVSFNNLHYFSPFISVTYEETNGIKELRIKTQAHFDEGIFSINQLKIIESVIKTFKNFSTSKLIEYLHKEGSLWHTIVKERNLEERFLYN